MKLTEEQAKQLVKDLANPNVLLGNYGGQPRLAIRNKHGGMNIFPLCEDFTIFDILWSLRDYKQGLERASGILDEYQRTHVYPRHAEKSRS